MMHSRKRSVISAPSSPVTDRVLPPPAADGYPRPPMYSPKRHYSNGGFAFGPGHIRTPSLIGEKKKRRSRLAWLKSKPLAFLTVLVIVLFLWGVWHRPRQPLVTTPFLLPIEPMPVEHQQASMNYANGPLSPHRPSRHQFELDHRSFNFDRPVVAIITATQNCRDKILETADSLFGQSLQNFVWVIVDDHTTNRESRNLLRDVAVDPRVIIVPNQGERGLASSRNVGLEYLLSRDYVPPYIVPLDDDDLFEFTALEKLAWFLESNENMALAGSTFIKFGASNETVIEGLHSGTDNYDSQNYVMNAAMIRSSAIVSSGCRYDPEGFNKSGGEDWDFWLCLAEAGHWGGTVAEHLYWYRVNPPSFRETRWGETFKQDDNWGGFHALHEHIMTKHEALSGRTAFPVVEPKPAVAFEPMTWDYPFSPNLAPSDKSIMFVIPWLMVGGADVGALHQMQTFAEDGYRITVVCTLYDYPSGIELRPQVMMLTHDVHILPVFLRPKDHPRYIKYLIESRGIGKVLLSNSQLLYEMLPALVQQLPNVEFFDYLHNEAYDGWKTAGYPQYSLIYRRYLARTIASSEYLRDWLVERGYDKRRIGIAKLGLDTTMYQEVHPLVRKVAKRQELDVDEDTLVLAFVGRLDPQKRPTLLPKIADELVKREPDRSFTIIVMGDGDLHGTVEREIKRLKLEERVQLLGTVPKPSDMLEAADIFLLPSVSEGLSIAVAEAMALGLPVVTANAGALPEQLGMSTANPGGILVNHTLTNDHRDARMYADEIERLAESSELRAWYGKNARRRVEQTFDHEAELVKLVQELDKGHNIANERKLAPLNVDRLQGVHPAAYSAVQTLLLEERRRYDLASTYMRLMRKV